jgi:hypothetical protein
MNRIGGGHISISGGYISISSGQLLVNLTSIYMSPDALNRKNALGNKATYLKIIINKYKCSVYPIETVMSLRTISIAIRVKYTIYGTAIIHILCHNGVVQNTIYLF